MLMGIVWLLLIIGIATNLFGYRKSNSIDYQSDFKKKRNPDPDATYKPPTNKVEPFMFNSFFLDPNYRKFAYRLLGIISGIVFVIVLYLIATHDPYWDEHDVFSLIMGLLFIPLVVFGLYHLIRWMLKALPEK